MANLYLDTYFNIPFVIDLAPARNQKFHPNHLNAYSKAFYILKSLIIRPNNVQMNMQW